MRAVQHGVLKGKPVDHVALCAEEYGSTMQDQIHAFRVIALRRIVGNAQIQPDGERWRASSNMTEEEIADTFADRRFEDNQRATQRPPPFTPRGSAWRHPEER